MSRFESTIINEEDDAIIEYLIALASPAPVMVKRPRPSRRRPHHRRERHPRHHVADINASVTARFPEGKEVHLLTSDALSGKDADWNNIPVEILNAETAAGLPPHERCGGHVGMKTR